MTAPSTQRVRHVVLTKYNARFSEDPDVRPGLDPVWLQGRLELFARWPLPSIRRQSAPPEQWLLFVDADTPAAHLEALRELVGEDAELVPVRGRLTDEAVGELLHARLPREPHVLLSTRLDSDDALAATHLERVRTDAGFRGFVNPTCGLQLVGGRLLRLWDHSSPFLTRIEDRRPERPPLTVFSVEHAWAHTAGPVRQLGGAPAWLQVIHGGNIANAAWGVPWPRRWAERALGVEEIAATGATAPTRDADPGVWGPAARQLTQLLRWRLRSRGRRS